MKRFAVILIACLSCGPSDNNGRGSTATTGKGGDGGVSSCGTHPKDSDGDGISDKDEGADEKPPRDTDRDGTPDYLDQDSDGDGIPDSIEGRNGSPCNPPVDSDGDGKPDFRDLDSDDPNDSSIPDHDEAGPDLLNPIDTNNNGAPDYMDKDNDGDGILDIFELTPQGSAVAVTVLANAPDTDGDGIPDFRDTDSDGDTILDIDEGTVDTDGDLIPNYRDTDSDGDCVPDAAEAGDSDPNTKPVDTDGDGAPDFEDTDSDNDGLIDGKEDKNCNGILDSCETNRLIADTDGDGVSDLIEYEDCAIKSPSVQLMTNCQCDGADSTKSPLTRGDFVFVVDYMMPPLPNQETLNLTTDVSRADVVFMIDVTASMGACATDIAANIGTTILTGVRMAVKDVAFGLETFQDFKDTFVVKYDYRIQSVRTPASVDPMNMTSIAYALAHVTSGDGNDIPEAGYEALYSLVGDPAAPLSGGGSNGYTAWSSNIVPAAPAAPLPMEEEGTLYTGKWRSGAVPIVVGVSDALWHDKPGVASSGNDGYCDYGSSCGTDCTATDCAGVPSRQDALNRLNSIGGHFVGLAINGTPKANMIEMAQKTNAIVHPSDFPAGRCTAGQCCTGNNNSPEAPLGGTDCPLAYTVTRSGSSCPVSQSIVDGISALAKSLKFDVHVQANDVDPMTVDNFIDKLLPNISGMGPAAMCVVVPASQLVDNFIGPHANPGQDGVMDTFLGLSGAVQICFDVIPKQNTTVMNTSQPQIFRAQLQVIGQTKTNNMTNSFNLGTPRDVFFLVPPVIINGPIN
jgi:hypothetical protein